MRSHRIQTDDSASQPCLPLSGPRSSRASPIEEEEGARPSGMFYVRRPSSQGTDEVSSFIFRLRAALCPGSSQSSVSVVPLPVLPLPWEGVASGDAGLARALTW